MDSVGGRPTVDIGVLTIRDDEFRAVIAAFPDKIGVYRAQREYTLRYADAGEGARYTVALLRQIEQGNGEAQEAARDLIDDLSPSLLLVVGIAGGLPSDDFTLGDVILSTRVNDYSVEARKAREQPTYNLSGGPIAKVIAAGLANLAARETELGPWTEALPERPKVTWNRQGQLYGPKKWQNELREKLEVHFGTDAEPRAPIFKDGAIASSDRLVKDPKVLFPWIQTARHLLAVEMESGGVYRAARDRCAMLAIRGISDLIGLKRNDSWTKYACASAAAFARGYLRTRPVPVKPTAEASIGAALTKKGPTADTLYANLIPLLAYPARVYIGPATAPTYERAWDALLARAKGKANKEHVSRAWILHNKLIYSFEDPEQSELSRVVDTAGVEEHDTKDLAEAADPERRRLFVQLLNGALREDLGMVGVWYVPDDHLYVFAGRADEPPRKYKYKNVHVRSTMTVVSHYSSKSADGREFRFLRHLAFAGRFRFLDEQWFLEVTPTYRFTTDGRNKYRFHEDQLSGIKRLEGNRAVLSQLLVWNSMLRELARPGGRPRLLTFGIAPSFQVENPISDAELTPVGRDIVADTDEEDDSSKGSPSDGAVS